MSTLYSCVVKRGGDLLAALILLITLTPALVVIAVLVRIRLGRPVIFRQQRPGRGGRIFTLLKFRTMLDGWGADGVALPDGVRITPFGARLRSLSLDELPELINIIRGDMSFVGPRPLLAEYLPLYSAFQARRHEVRPGLTGLAQVSGRNSIPWDERLALDVWYVDHISMRLDLSLLAKTVATVIHRRGITANGDVTMPPFQG